MRNVGPQPGDIVAGRYRLVSLLGRGRGVLALAEHTGFEQKVAIRIVSPQIADAVEVAKFKREAAALAKLGSEHVARILDVGTLPDGSLYLVRQYLEGVDLAAHLARRGALPVQEALGWILQATEAVAEAHAYGILHRELSPERLFLAERSPGVRSGPRVLKVIDFATAKLLRDPSQGQAPQNEQTTVLGLSPYSSPEMLRRHRDLDVRTDVWSLGAILYEMFVGRPPFGKDMVSLAVAISRDEPTAISSLNPDVSTELEEAVHKALAKDKANRHADTHAFAASLVRFAPQDSRLLMERIHDLAQSARSGMGMPEDDAMEISEIEEVSSDISEESTGDDNIETRVAKPDMKAGALRSMLPPVPRLEGSISVTTPQPLKPKAPAESFAARPAQGARRPLQEKTETLGMSFVPIDPLKRGSAAAAGANKGPVFAGAAANEPTQMLGSMQAPQYVQPIAPMKQESETTGLPAFRPPAGLAMQQGPVPMPSQTDPPPSSAWGTNPPSFQPRFGAPPSSSNDDDASFGRKIAMYAVGGALAAILILTIMLAVLIMGGK